MGHHSRLRISRSAQKTTQPCKQRYENVEMTGLIHTTFDNCFSLLLDFNRLFWADHSQLPHRAVEHFRASLRNTSKRLFRLNSACWKIGKDRINPVFESELDLLPTGMETRLIKFCVIKRPRYDF